MNIEEAKEFYQKKMSEDLFGIVNPPEYQCQYINTIVKTLKDVYKSTSKAKYMGENDLIDLVNDINRELYRIDDDIEDIRGALENARKWGQEWKDLCKKIIERYNIDVQELI
ncbi:hypothetical protein EDM57_04435 [Brevibacillus gelatini]|uniref:Uncharacterized protein n=1 Tax=Brevibacillus gelatini TaxID=1655277 RepID=A0A3M8B983_9BACL|nr:hypothetical protein [Brevibacillus gelatini]RNB59395.1 hypothetical protein EDM57_04435 [Brevibacillus gelatini]